MDILTFISKHIWHVLPNLILAFIALGIILERAVSLFIKFPHHELNTFLYQIYQNVVKANIKEAVGICDAHKESIFAYVVREALIRSHLPESNIQDGLNLALQKVTTQIQKKISFLSIIANVSTLIGLVGTIVGLINSFEALGFADPQQKSALLASGISTAMNATLIGLFIAIGCLLSYSVLNAKANQILSELEQTALYSLDALKQRFYTLEEQGNK